MGKIWPKTSITELLKIPFPIIQAPMAGATTPELVAAVSNAGGLGSLAAGYMNPNEMRNAIKKIRQLTKEPFGVNLFIPEKHQATHAQIEKARIVVQEACHELNFHINPIKPPYAPTFEEQMNVIFKEKVPVFSFTFGVPSPEWIEDFRKIGIVLIGTATTPEEAILLEKNKIDAVVAQGSEAGGHRGTFLGRAEDALTSVSLLVPLICEHVKIPVIAAGGIMDARGILASIKLGASAVQMGTAFLCSNESSIHALYKKLLLDTEKDDTTLTKAFSGKLARGLVNKFIRRMQAHADAILNYPIQNALTSAMRREAGQKNMADFMSMWAGQGVNLCKKLPAAQLIRELNNEAVELIKNNSDTLSDDP